MTIQLRPYQEEAIEAIEASWDEGINRPTAVLATGLGKTTIFSALIGRHVERLRKEGKRILLLAHRGELLDQAEARIKLQNPGIWTAVVKGSRGQKTHQFADVVIASAQTLARPKRREAVDRIGMVIVDECHTAASKSYKDILDHYGCTDERATPTVGFTATLTRMDGGLPEVWQSVAYEKKIHWAVKNGFLVPPVARSVEVPGLNLSKVRVTGGELNAKDIADALDDSHAFPVIVEAWQQHAADRSTIVFMPNVATTEKMRDAFLAAGVKAELIVGSMGPDARRGVYERYNTGATQVLVNCFTLIEGFDAPHTSCVVIGRPMLNPGGYIQATGRGLRLAPGKDDCLVLDVAGASLKHNLAGVNDLESDCEGRCDCNCLTCGCSDRCKCGIRQCGCRCLEQHEKAPKACLCAGTEDCGCGCHGDPGTGLEEDMCCCYLNPDCACRGEGEQPEQKEVSAEVLKNLTEVDILGASLDKSHYRWLRTRAGIHFLQVGPDKSVFLLPAPEGGFFQGLVEGSGSKAPVTRLDTGALPADEAKAALEAYADVQDYTYNGKKASWRRTPASDAQKALLSRMGVTVPEGCRKGEASDLLSVQKASRVLDPRFSSYVKNQD